MNDTRKRLSNYLGKLSNAIENQKIQSEADLDALFRVKTQQQLNLLEIIGISSSEENATLLEILGYNSENVEDHPVKVAIIGRMNYVPDYVLNYHPKLPLAVIDLKAPEVNLDIQRSVGQIISYCREIKAPLGLLFNGRSVRVYINTEVKGLTKFKELTGQSVASANERA